MNKPLDAQELHNLAMNLVGKDLEKRGFEFIAVNSKLKTSINYSKYITTINRIKYLF